MFHWYLDTLLSVCKRDGLSVQINPDGSVEVISVEADIVLTVSNLAKLETAIEALKFIREHRTS